MRADVHDGTFVDDKGRRELGHFTVRAVKRHAIEHGLGGVEGASIQMPLVTRRRPGRLRRQCARAAIEAQSGVVLGSYGAVGGAREKGGDVGFGCVRSQVDEQQDVSYL